MSTLGVEDIKRLAGLAAERGIDTLEAPLTGGLHRAALGEISAELETAQIWGHPVSEICNFAVDKNADLVVMGSHGRSGLKGVLLGSVSHAVVNRATCAVTIVR